MNMLPLRIALFAFPTGLAQTPHTALMKIFRTLSIAALMTGSLSAQATLIDQGDGTVLDDTLNVLWLKDWNVNGQQDRDTQVSWADGLVFANSSNWLLPTQGDYLSLFNQFGDLQAQPIFNNVQNALYWASDILLAPTHYYQFQPVTGGIGVDNGSVLKYAVAFRDASIPFDVNQVPEPTTAVLLGLGLLGAGFARKRRTH